ncbi:MAG: AraC family transcriptional regulator [Candidatus Izemoplasmatales bacterium]|nr:AraC family transcriptional regulator [Candidatus Izemoplasmatales bacterium]MDY0138616.1 AraC family transcriptional regulator [Candidatus Izemoplasmatales bacterium]
MEWITTIKEVIAYIEDDLLTIKGPKEVAKHVHISQMYLQQGFHIMTGFTIGEYIRNRRLYLSAIDLVNNEVKVIDTAYKYGYDTPESFTKAFTRFHGVTPSKVKRDRRLVKTFLPLRINIIIQGGNSMEYTIEKINSFKVIGFSREFSYETSYREIPSFWSEIFKKYEENLCGGKEPVNEIEKAVFDNRIGEFGICIDDIEKDGYFRYMIAGGYRGGSIPEGMEVYELAEQEWAKFKCIGAIPEALQTINSQIWNEWLPGNNNYELAGKYNIEWYSGSGKTTDVDYQSAIWIPVRRK